MKISAVIFDVDGTMIDNNPYHKKAWSVFLKKHEISLDTFDYRKLFGKHNKEILNFVFGRELSAEESKEHAFEKEAIYREIYRPHIKPQKGLVKLLQECKAMGIKLGTATSAPPENLDFVLDELGVRSYFDACVDASQVNKSKPNPEIFYLTARKLKKHANECLVFEDSPSGIKGAINAGMKVIGVNVIDIELAKKHCEMIVDDFEEFSRKYMSSIFRKS
jgi:beta-phosphoglucomutase family hydrolase